MVANRFFKGALTLLLLCWFVITHGAEPDPADSPATPASLRARIEAVMAEKNVPAVSYAIFAEDGIRIVEALGKADVSSGRSLTDRTKLRIGSVTKTFTALLTMRAIEQGRFTLETPVRDMLPEPLIDNPYETEEPVRIIHLLEHTAGIDDMTLHAIYRDQEMLDPILVALRHDARALRVRWRPGTRMSYSNTGYSVLAAVLEHSYQRDYESLVQEHVLQPLAMHDTVVTNAAAQRSEFAKGYTGEAMTDVGLPPIWHRPAGAVWSTARDVAQLGRFLMTDGKSHPGVLQPETVREMRRVHSTSAAQAGLEWGYGLGVYHARMQGLTLFGHNGAIDGFSANLYFNPERGMGFAEIHNSDNTMVRFAKPLAGYLSTLPVKKSPAEEKTQPVTAELAKALSGWYRTSNPRNELMRGADWLIGAWHAEMVGDELQLQPLLGEPIRLQYVGRDRWQDRQSGEVNTIMLRDADGRIEAIDADGAHFQRTSLFAVLAPICALMFGVIALLTSPFGRRRALHNPWLRRLNLSSLLALSLVFAGLAALEGIRTAATVSLGPILILAGTLLLPLLTIATVILLWSRWRTETAQLAKWRCLMSTAGAATISIYFACFNWLALALWTR